MASASYQCVDTPCRVFSDDDHTALSVGRPAINPKWNIFLPEISELLRCSRMPYIDSSNDNIFIVDRNLVAGGGATLSAEGIVRVAAAHCIMARERRDIVALPFGLSQSILTTEEVKNVELVCRLVEAADKVGNQQFDRANSLLRQCFLLASPTGGPVQRVVYYFAEALREKVDRESGCGLSSVMREIGTITADEINNVVLTNHPVHLTFYNILPFAQVMHFTSVQAILDSTASANRLHIIDLAIKHGLQWMMLMQALATRDVSLKISAVAASEDAMVPVCKRLSAFAESLGLRFEFVAVAVPDLKDLTEDMFEVDEGETLAIFSHLVMNNLIVSPDKLENLMRVICRLKPHVVTVIDLEMQLNSPSFVNRFTEALFFYSAYFDCVDGLMKKSDVSNRMMIEASLLSKGIKSVLAAEGSERAVRRVGVEVWRCYYGRFGMMEAELSERSTRQASYLLKLFAKDGSLTMERNGESLLLGWKGTPFMFISVLKFRRKCVMLPAPNLSF